MGVGNFVIGVVGKPSAGKSSFLNSATDAVAKVGNYPFTTIKPNHGITYYQIDCPCKKYNKQEFCQPKYGKCVDGARFLPIEMLDVAGLVPGASEGEGLGNQFLDDLRGADVLIHVVDVSGTTDQNGKVTTGYDPINDIDWLHSEIHNWVYNNLKKKWVGIVRRHKALKCNAVETLTNQLCGYGTNAKLVGRFMDKLGSSEPLENWDDETLHKVVEAFLDERFPTIVALNKIDLPESGKNIEKICRKYGEERVVLTSALAECFLRKLDKQKFIKYYEGTEFFDLAEDQVDPSPEEKLKPLDEKTRGRLEKVQDMVLYRYGNTGVVECIRKAVECLNVIPVFPVKNVNNFSSGRFGTKTVFSDCFLVPGGTTVREFAKIIHPELDKYYQYAETVGNIRLGEDDIITLENNIICIKTSQVIQKKTNDDKKKENQNSKDKKNNEGNEEN